MWRAGYCEEGREEKTEKYNWTPRLLYPKTWQPTQQLAPFSIFPWKENTNIFCLQFPVQGTPLNFNNPGLKPNIKGLQSSIPQTNAGGFKIIIPFNMSGRKNSDVSEIRIESVEKSKMTLKDVNRKWVKFN